MGKQTSNQSGPARLADFALTLAVMLPLFLGSIRGLILLEYATCPDGTFLVGSTLGDFVIIPLLIGAVLASALVRRGLFSAVPALQEWLKIEPLLLSKQTAKVLLGSGIALCAATALYVSESQYCATADSFYFRTALWQSYQQLSWQELRAVVTSCSAGSRGAWRPGYVLVFSDRKAFNLANSFDFHETYPALMRALHPYDFVFDRRRVVPDCGYGYASALTTRP